MTPQNDLVTYILLVYEQEEWVRPALESAFAQDYQPLQILVCDDASTDRTAEVIRSMIAGYAGPHQVQFIRQETNLIVDHLNAVLPYAKGRFTVMAHGDDIAFANRTSEMVRIWKETGCSLVTANAWVIDEHGTRSNMWIPPGRYDMSLRYFVENLGNAGSVGAGMGWDREIFDHFGPLKHGPRQLDLMLMFRACLLRGAQISAEPLMEYRRHSGNLSIDVMLNHAQDVTRRIWIEERRLNNEAANICAMIETLRDMKAKHEPVDPAIEPILAERLFHVTRAWTELRQTMALQRLTVY